MRLGNPSTYFQSGANHPKWSGGLNRFPTCLKCDKKLSSMKSRHCRKHAFELKRAEDHPFWVKDRSKLKRSGESQLARRSSDYMIWRKRVWERDSHTCKINNSDCGGKLEAHHILGFTEHPTLRYETNNGITLCHAHHPRKRSEEKRLSPYFMELVSVSKVQY